MGSVARKKKEKWQPETDWVDPRKISPRLVRDPDMSDAEFWHQRHSKPDQKNLGLKMATVDLKEFIGGFWRYKDRTEAQTMAAARFKSLHEACQLGGARAADYAAPYVDTSFGSATLLIEHTEAVRARYRDAVRAIGMQQSNLLEKVIIYDISQRRIAAAYGYGNNRTGRRKVSDQVYLAADHLALHFHM